MNKQEFILKLFQEGKDYLKMIFAFLTFVIGLHLRQPNYMVKKDDDSNGHK